MVMLGCVGFGLALLAKSVDTLKAPPVCHKHYFTLKEPLTTHIILGIKKKRLYLYLKNPASKHCFIKCNKQRLDAKLGKRKATSTLTLCPSVSSFRHSITLCQRVTFYCKMWWGWMTSVYEYLVLEKVYLCSPISVWFKAPFNGSQHKPRHTIILVSAPETQTVAPHFPLGNSVKLYAFPWNIILDTRNITEACTEMQNSLSHHLAAAFKWQLQEGHGCWK